MVDKPRAGSAAGRASRPDLVDNAAKVVYPSHSKHMLTNAEVDDLRTELERLRVLVKELQDRVDRLEQASSPRV